MVVDSQQMNEVLGRVHLSIYAFTEPLRKKAWYVVPRYFLSFPCRRRTNSVGYYEPDAKKYLERKYEENALQVPSLTAVN